MTDEHGMPPDRYREMPAWWVSRTKAEWRSRTAWGKLTFPVWLLLSIAVWSVGLPAMEIAYRLKWALHHLKRLKPATHKEDANGG